MSIIDQARADLIQFTGDANGFGESLTFTAPAPGSETAIVIGFNTKHHMAYDIEGQLVNTRTISVAVAEALLIAESYPVRNPAGDVDLNDHLVDAPDANGNIKNYIVRKNFPDEELGLIVLILQDYTP